MVLKCQSRAWMKSVFSCLRFESSTLGQQGDSSNPFSSINLDVTHEQRGSPKSTEYMERGFVVTQTGRLIYVTENWQFSFVIFRKIIEQRLSKGVIRSLQ